MTEQLKTSGSVPVVFDSGEGGRLSFQAQDEQDPAVDIDANNLTTLVLTLTDNTGKIINNRKEVDILGTGIGTIEGDGTVTVRLQPEDNPFLSQANDYKTERHHVIFKYTWNDGVETRTGKSSYYFSVVNIP